MTERAAVAVPVVGVVIGRRRDGRPPWTFPGGKIEPGESPEDAAVRETFEGTGSGSRVTGIIGSRVHPVTGGSMVCVAAELADEPGVMADGSSDLAEVRWVSLAEVGGLMKGMSGDVYRRLAQALGS